MKSTYLIPIAMLAFAVACSENATAPDDPVGPNFAPGTGAHFSNVSAAIDLTGPDRGDLDITFTESGLGNSPTPSFVLISAVAQVTLELGCINGGGKHPEAANKETITTEASAPPTPFEIGKNGSVKNQVVTIPLPSASSLNFSCPPGQSLELGTVTWFDVTITDENNNALTSDVDAFAVTGGSVGGEYTHTFLDF